MSKFTRVIGITGRILVVTGVLVLYYTAYLLWGTSQQTRQAQAELTKQLETTQSAVETPVAATMDPSQIPSAKPAQDPKLGDALFEIVIPKIGLRQVVVSGVDAAQLQLGPGHFPDSPFPGEPGNVPISGHRTTYDAPFYRLDELVAGDEIFVERSGFRYRYEMATNQIVSPRQVEVVEYRGRNELTLTTCHPKFSAAQRLIVHADYKGPEVITTESSSANFDAADAATQPAKAIPYQVFWLAGAAIISFLTAMALSTRLRKTAAWGFASLVFGAAMWIAAFPEIVKLLPAEY